MSADFYCRSSLSYSVKIGKEETPQQVFWLTVQGVGRNEGEAKRELERRSELEKPKALARCAEKHEAFGRCMASSYAARASTLSSLGFSARKALEESIGEECRRTSGQCLSVEASEVKCEERIDPAVAQATAAALEAEKAKGEKGGKKK